VRPHSKENVSSFIAIKLDIDVLERERQRLLQPAQRWYKCGEVVRIVNLMPPENSGPTYVAQEMSIFPDGRAIVMSKLPSFDLPTKNASANTIRQEGGVNPMRPGLFYISCASCTLDPELYNNAH